MFLCQSVYISVMSGLFDFADNIIGFLLTKYYFVFQCLLVGDSEGQVTVLQLRSMPTPPAPEKQV